ncbi:MAG: DUF1376 domain-containing protein [Pseudomonas sp.]|nr:DUF1376 domain-containing protein [Pseudomonas sp.]
MAALPYMQLYVADYLADTMHLTTEEHGAYLLLIFNYWQTGKPIPMSRLARITRLSNERWTDVERSLGEFFNERGNEWFHDRIERDLEAVRATQEQRIAAGRASAEARKQAAKPRTKPSRNTRSTTVGEPLNGKATNIEEKREEESKELHTHTAQAKFSLHDDWEPNPTTFTAVLFRNGMANQTFEADQLLEFRSYWISRPDDLKTQAQWEHALAQQLKRQARTQQANGGIPNETGRRTAQSRTRNAHDILTDPDW